MNAYPDEGYIKFDLRWEQAAAPVHACMDVLCYWRNQLFEHQLIGYDAQHQVGYGNISHRTDAGFIISGSQTGHLPQAEHMHFTEVHQWNIALNLVYCKGPIAASSESLTHAAVYDCSPSIMAVVHVHHDALWKENYDQLPTSSSTVAYGTPDMALELARLYEEGTFAAKKVMVMGGHKGGLISFGTTLQEASERLLALIR